jgi:perosamine synthetase
MIEQIKPYGINKAIPEVVDYLNSGAWLVEFKYTKEFEKRLAAFLGVKHCIMCTSGTAALSLACMAMLHIKKDARRFVLVPDFTMIATAHAVTLGAFADPSTRPELVDVDLDTLCMNTDRLKGAGKHGICGVMYVDINGRSGDLEELRALCDENKWFFIEDACQAFGSKHNGKYLGTFGDVGCFSLSPQKIITTGQGGFLVTNSDEVAYTIRKFKDHGRIRGGIDEFDAMGFNFKYTDLLALIGLRQLESIEWRLQRKKEIYNQYYSLLTDSRAKMIKNDDDTVPWVVDIFSEKRDLIVENFRIGNIGCRVVYPPLHEQHPFYFSDSDYKNAVKIGKTGLWVPSHLELTDKEIGFVCEKILEII